MKLFITHESALSYWLGPYARLRDASEAFDVLPSEPLSGFAIDPEDFERLGMVARPLHVAVASPDQRNKRRDCRCHLMGGSIPEGAFMPIKGDIWVASPELAFCEAAETKSLPELVKLGYELCASFRINEFTEDTETRQPLTDSVRLLHFCNRFDGRGAKRARTAARYVRGGTESPMEIALAMLLTLPRMYGGYGLPLAEPNREIGIAKRGDKRITYRYRGDLVWHKQKVIAEYDSNLHHRAPRKISEDAIRRNNLQDAGWRVVTVTWEQVRTTSGTDTVADQLARALGVRNPYNPKEAAARRIGLRAMLFPWAFPGFEGF